MLSTLHPHAAGIDAGSTKFFVATPDGAVTAFESFTLELYRLRDHLLARGVTTVAIEATGVYWLVLFEVLETAGLEVCVVNGAHVRNVPGRKSDVQDCQWLQQLHAHGLLRKSFVPPEAIRALRSYTRLREDHIRQSAMHVHLMQKALDQLNVKLHTVISQLNGVSGLAVVRATRRGSRPCATSASLKPSAPWWSARSTAGGNASTCLRSARRSPAGSFASARSSSAMRRSPRSWRS
jgi:hypothetical protein